MAGPCGPHPDRQGTGQLARVPCDSGANGASRLPARQQVHLKQGGSIAAPGSEAFVTSHGAPSHRSACNAGDDPKALWPREFGDLPGRHADQACRTGDCQRARKGLLQQVETPRNGQELPGRPRMPTGTGPIPRLAATAGPCEGSAQIDLDDLAPFGAMRWRCGFPRSVGRRRPSMHPAARVLARRRSGISTMAPISFSATGMPCPEDRHDAHSAGRAPCACRGHPGQLRPRPAVLSDEG